MPITFQLLKKKHTGFLADTKKQTNKKNEAHNQKTKQFVFKLQTTVLTRHTKNFFPTNKKWVRTSQYVICNQNEWCTCTY